MIPSFADFLATQKLKKYVFHPPTVHAQWGYNIMTQRATGPRGGETFRTRSYYGAANHARCAEILRKQLENTILARLKK